MRPILGPRRKHKGLQGLVALDPRCVRRCVCKVFRPRMPRDFERVMSCVCIHLNMFIYDYNQIRTGCDLVLPPPARWYGGEGEKLPATWCRDNGGERAIKVVELGDLPGSGTYIKVRSRLQALNFENGLLRRAIRVFLDILHACTHSNKRTRTSQKWERIESKGHGKNGPVQNAAANFQTAVGLLLCVRPPQSAPRSEHAAQTALSGRFTGMDLRTEKPKDRTQTTNLSHQVCKVWVCRAIGGLGLEVRACRRSRELSGAFAPVRDGFAHHITR